MIAITRFRVPDGDEVGFRVDVAAAHALLAARPGYLGGEVGRNVDDPSLWVLSTRWEHVGAYRRALSSYEVKAGALPLLARAIDEPGAYEELAPGATGDHAEPRSIG